MNREPFNDQTNLHDLNTERYPDPHCTIFAFDLNFFDEKLVEEKKLIVEFGESQPRFITVAICLHGK